VRPAQSRGRVEYIPPIYVLAGLTEDVFVLRVCVLNPANETNGTKEVQPEKVRFKISATSLYQQGR